MWFIPSEEKRLKREIKRIQAFCSHQWVVVSKYRGEYDMYYDMYCPACDVLSKGREERVKERLLSISKEREAYQRKIHRT